MIKLAPIIVNILMTSLKNMYPITIEKISSVYLYGTVDDISVAFAAFNIQYNPITPPIPKTNR